MHVAVFATIKDGMRKKRQDLEAEFDAYLDDQGRHAGVSLLHGGPTPADDGETVNGLMQVVEAPRKIGLVVGPSAVPPVPVRPFESLTPEAPRFAAVAAPVIVVSVAGPVAAVPAHGAADGPALHRVNARRR